MKRNRYPGTRSFQKEDADIFFGREDDKKKLLQLIRLEQLLVLYGKSGLGKTSLLNAGILPMLGQASPIEMGEEEEWTDEEAAMSQQNWQTLEVRFHAWHEATERSPSEVFREETTGTENLHPLLAKIEPNASGWWYAFKSRQLESGESPIFLLVFDQFEELFTYPAEQVAAFKRSFADLLQAEMPRHFRRTLRQQLRDNPQLLSSEERQLLYRPLQIKTILSIRSDRLSLLDQLTDVLPNLLVNLYELKPLQRAQAQAAIVLPASKKDKDFDTTAFAYSPAALEAILDHLSSEKGEVEPFQIQYICEHAEDIVRAKSSALGINSEEKTSIVTVEAADLGDLQGLFRRFYDNKIATLGAAERQQTARRLLEDRLIFNGIRLSILREQITDKKGYNIPQSLLDKLENLRLLRAERRNDRVYYEITHDTLVEPILESKEEWLLQKRLEEEEKQRLVREKEIAEERKKRQRARRLAAFMALLAVFSLVASGIAFWQYRHAQTQTKEAIAAKDETETALETARLEKERADSLRKVAEAETLRAEQAKIEADSNKNIAIEREKEAQANAEKARLAEAATKKTLRDLETTTDKVAELQLTEAHEMILRLEYEAALEKFNTVAALGRQQEAIAKGMMEIAFFYGESGRVSRALGILDTAAQLVKNTVVTQKIASISDKENFEKEQFRELMKQMDEAHFLGLMSYYYPSMIPIKGGTFTMGCDTLIDNNCGDDEFPQHQVTVSDFYMAETETTIFQMALYSVANGLDKKRFTPGSQWLWTGEHPAVYLDWYDAVEYANWASLSLGREPVYVIDTTRQDTLNLNRYDDKKWVIEIKENANGFRLPYEAEWEYAARANQKTIYAGTSDLDNLYQYANYSGSEDAYDKTAPVKSLEPNAFGLFDMSGNVYEWCWNWHGDYSEDVQSNLRGLDRGSFRVLRGGSWDFDPLYCRVSFRYGIIPDRGINLSGFRIAYR